MKILVLQDDFPPLNIGGAGAIAYETARGLIKRGHEVEVVTTVRSEVDAGVVELQGLRIHRIATSYDMRWRAYMSLWNPSAVRKVRRIIQDFKPDVVHAHNVHGYLSYASLKVAKRSGVKVILTCHDVMPFNYGKFVQYIDPTNLSIQDKFDYRVSPLRQLKDEKWRYNPFRNLVIRFILRRYVDKIVAVSFALKDALGQNGIDSVVIHNGIESNAWSLSEKNVAAFQERHSLGKSVVLFSGKPAGAKGGKHLVEAIAGIIKEIPDIQLLVPGRLNADMDILTKHAEHFRISDRLIFPGWLTMDVLSAAYHSSRLVVVPSLCFDSFPTMILEAFSCKKPVIASCFGGSRELVENDVSGYIVNPFHVSKFSEKIIDILRNEVKALSFGLAGFERVRNYFTLEDQVGAYEELFRKMGR